MARQTERPPVTSGFSLQRANIVEKVCMIWRLMLLQWVCCKHSCDKGIVKHNFQKEEFNITNLHCIFFQAGIISCNDIVTYGKPTLIMIMRLISSRIYCFDQTIFTLATYVFIIRTRAERTRKIKFALLDLCYRGNLWPPVDSPHNGPMIRKVFSRHDVLMFSIPIGWWDAPIFYS